MAEQAPSADATNEPVAAAADPSLHKHSSHKHSSQKEILSELLSIADIPVASHKPSSSSSHHHSRHHATPTTVVDPMHIKVAAEHLKAARQHQIIEEDASGSATGSSPPKQRIRNRIAASANANASLDSFLTTPGDNSQSGNQTAGDGSVSANANEGSGVASVSGLEEMFPSYSGHAKANAVTETVANVAELKIKDASTSGKNDEGETRESNVGSEDAQPSASAVADTTPQPRGSAAASVNVETSEVLAAIRLWGANTGAANAARNADSAFLQPYQGSSYSSYVDDHRTSPSVAREARAREELAKLERSRSKSYPELAELDKAATVPKIKALGGMRSGEKSKDAAMDKLGIGQEDSEYADTEYFGWLLSGGSKFAKPSNTRQGQEQPPPSQ
ncbi:hypothetical protein CLOM_g8370 [Closterium sp. NIES-68]|nr:hypothetical protein CLOM_g8370 [Closterium sp. NIES-68]GJP77399.1 hypothetical protein CLOP_g7797 [Closterium sp. NIES-67]